MTETTETAETNDGVREAEGETRATIAESVRRSPLDYGALVVVIASALLLLAGVIYAFAVADARDVDGSERFRLLAQASSPFVAGLALIAITLVVHERRRGDDPALVGGSAALGVGSAVSLVALLLALNGIVVDVTSDVDVMFVLSNVIGRLATVVLAGFGLWLSATTPIRRQAPVVGSEGRPVHS